MNTWFIVMSKTTGNIYVHNQYYTHDFEVIKGFATKHQAIEYYRRIVNSALDELIEMTEEKRA